MRRGDIYTAATGGGYGSKPRPVLVIQNDAFRTTAKTLVALIGSPFEGAELVRVRVDPDPTNRLEALSEIMVDAILPVRREQFGVHVGRLSDADLRRVEIALMTFIGVGSTE